jgi:NAD(P)-dependent dehydrogenase (short-subunit alcohol dehydrogenase family)
LPERGEGGVIAGLGPERRLPQGALGRVPVRLPGHLAARVGAGRFRAAGGDGDRHGGEVQANQASTGPPGHLPTVTAATAGQVDEGPAGRQPQRRRHPCALESLGDQEIAAQVGTNLLGPIYTCRAAIPLLRAAGGGEIINTSSEVTIEVLPFQSIYAVTKSGLEALGRSLNYEYEKEDIRTTTIIQGVALGDGGGTTDWDHNPEMTSVMWPRLQAEGTIARVIGKHGGQSVESVAEVHLFIVTRPRGQKLDVIRVRSY